MPPSLGKLFTQKREVVESMSPKQWENGYRTTTICIDSYEKGVPVGRFYNQYCPEGVSFYGAIDLIKKMETMLEQMNFLPVFFRSSFFCEKTERRFEWIRQSKFV